MFDTFHFLDSDFRAGPYIPDPRTVMFGPVEEEFLERVELLSCWVGGGGGNANATKRPVFWGWEICLESEFHFSENTFIYVYTMQYKLEPPNSSCNLHKTESQVEIRT